MGRPLHRREAPARDAIATPPERVAEESRLVSLAYLVWPVAIYDRIVPRDEASAWYRFHMRQALWFGALSALIGLAAFAWPLVLSILVSNISATIWMYELAGLVDLALFVIWLVLAMRYSQRASRGDLFDVPWVARLTKRWNTPN